MAESIAKGNFIDLKTFETYKDVECFGVKTNDVKGKQKVIFVWCKVCSKHKDELRKIKRRLRDLH